MTKQTLDSLLKAMLQSGDGISDLLFVAGKPPITEDHGKLTEFPIDTPRSVLIPALIQEITALIIDKSERLMGDFARLGSCDCSAATRSRR